MAAGQTGLRAVITSGTFSLGTQNLVPGFNRLSFDGMTTGPVSVKVLDGSGATVVSGTGPLAVSDTFPELPYPKLMQE